MSWLTDKFRKLFSFDGEEGKEVRKIVELDLNGLKSIVEERIEKDSARKADIGGEFVRRIDKFEIDLKEALENLKGIDLTKRKENEKLKLVVENNYYLYCNYVGRLLNDISATKSLEFDEMFLKISSIIGDFSKKAFEPYEKATILIGEKMEKTKKIIAEFARDFESKRNENGFFENSLIVEEINDLIAKVRENEGYCLEIDREIVKINERKNKLNDSLKAKEDEIEKIKRSDEYAADLRINEEIENRARELEKSFSEVKSKIDLKLLANYAHFDEKKNKLVKDYKNNFRQALIEDEKLEIVQLALDAQNLDVGFLKGMREEFVKMKEQIVTNSDRKISAIDFEMKKIIDEISSLDIKIESEKRKREKLVEKGKGIVLEIKEAIPRVFADVVLVQ